MRTCLTANFTDRTNTLLSCRKTSELVVRKRFYAGYSCCVVLHDNVYVLTFRALKLVHPRVDAKAYYYCRPTKSDLESSENSTNNKFSSHYIDGIRKLKKNKWVIFFACQNGERNGREINERENEKKNFSLCTGAPLPSEKIWEREKQKQTIYGNVYRNTIKDGDSQTSPLISFLFCEWDVFSQAGRIYEEISEICFKWSSSTNFES